MSRNEPGAKRQLSGVTLITAVQSVACAVVILALLLIRLCFGELFALLGTRFEEAMGQNLLADAVYDLFDDEAVGESGEPNG